MGENITITSKFEENWNILENEINVVKRENLLPFSFSDIDGTETTRTEEDFNNQLKSLKENKFTISVCGMVKAGKSTFLNALLFGEDILPAFDTPMTAKINFIEYTPDKNHFVVNFYSREEWKELLASLDEENLLQLRERMQLCAEMHGVDEDQCVNSPAITEKNLRKLEEYVSDPKSKNGKYTPYVKDVHIYINNDSIKDVRIVDTPGLNDPNVINSRETTKWIKNTHALIFLLPPKSIDESSLNFFDTHLLGTRPSNRVWVINKIDDITDDDFKKSVAYLHTLGQQEDFKKKNLFGRDEKICGYSALISMLRNMYNHGIELTEDQNYHLDEVGDDFNPDPNNLPEVIGDRLYQNTGIKRIIAGYTAFDTLYSQHIAIANKKILFSEMNISDLSKDDGELEKEIKLIEEKRREFTSQLTYFKKELSSVVFQAINENVKKPMDKSIDSLQRKISAEIDSCASATAMRNIPYFFRDECEKPFGSFGKLSEGVEECSQVLFNELQSVRQKIKRLFAQNEIEGSIDFSPIDSIVSINFSLEDMSNDIYACVDNALPSNWFTETFTFKETMRSRTKGPLLDALGKIRESMGTNSQDMRVKVEAQISGSFETFNSNIEESCLQKRRILEADKGERANKLMKAKSELEEAQKIKTRIEDIQREFKHKFPQEIWMSNK